MHLVTEYTPWSLAAAEPLLDRWKAIPGGLLQMLIEAQEHFGYIEDELIPVAADSFNLSRAEVVGVVSFYHDFRNTPSAPHRLKICLAESCQAVGSANLVAQVAATLGSSPGERSQDGRFDVEPVYCLGNCALSPAVMLDGRVYGRMTPARAAALIEGAG
jgi:formate dehydrogenase subunit gamma